jgi:hypothetical protein
LSAYPKEIEQSYLRLYRAVGSDMATNFNADDRVPIELAGNEKVRKGQTYHCSKNSGHESQLKKLMAF